MSDDVDGLSSIPLDIEPLSQQYTEECSQDMIASALVALRDDEPTNQIMLAREARAQEDVLLSQINVKRLNQSVSIKMQSEDPDLQSVINMAQKEKKPSKSERSKLTRK